MKKENQPATEHVVSRQMLFPFILITSLFALWGFANDITNPMVAAFGSVMEISTAHASLVQFAFYGGYATMAIPAALFIQKFSYKRGIQLGLALYALGALLFFPAAQYQMFGFFLVSLYILTFGLAFLETTANPYILSMGSVETSTRRLNLAQAFNPIGSLMGMFVASQFILANLQSDKVDDFSALPAAVKETIRLEDLMVIRNPYVILGLVVIFMLIVITVTKMPKILDLENRAGFRESVKALFANKIYIRGVVAQIFYVGAQIMCWTYIIHYAGRLGIEKADAQMYNIFAMGMFLVGRFIATGLMKFVNSRLMLAGFGCGAIVCTLGTIFIDGMAGLYCLMGISIFMSLMFPTIYGIALEGIGRYATLGAAGLVMAIVGGALMPPMQGWIIDQGEVMGLPSENASFVLPLICFLVVTWFGYRSYRAITK